MVPRFPCKKLSIGIRYAKKSHLSWSDLGFRHPLLTPAPISSVERRAGRSAPWPGISITSLIAVSREFFLPVRSFLADPKNKGANFTQEGMESPQTKDFCANGTQKKFIDELQPTSTSPALWASPRRRISMRGDSQMSAQVGPTLPACSRVVTKYFRAGFPAGYHRRVLASLRHLSNYRFDQNGCIARAGDGFERYGRDSFTDSYFGWAV